MRITRALKPLIIMRWLVPSLFGKKGSGAYAKLKLPSQLREGWDSPTEAEKGYSIGVKSRISQNVQ